MNDNSNEPDALEPAAGADEGPRPTRTTRRNFLERSRRNRRAHAQSGRSFDPVAMIRLAFFGVALLVAAAVYVGFWRQGETIYDGPWGAMQRLITPLFLGINALELFVLVAVGLVAWRIWRRL